MAKIQNFVRPLIVVGLVVGMSLMANTASARHRTCHPAAKAHMKTAIRLMTIACDKPLRVAKSLARAASVHVGLSLRFTRNPSAIAQLHAVKASLDHFVHSYCAPPFHTGIEQTRLALTLECNPCACGNPACRGGCAIPARPGRVILPQQQIDYHPVWNQSPSTPSVVPLPRAPAAPYPAYIDMPRGRGF